MKPPLILRQIPVEDFTGHDLRCKWERVSGVKVVDGTVSSPEITARSDSSFDVSIGALHGVYYIHTGGKIARNGS